MNIGIDYHDTLTYNPQFFMNILKSWEGKIYIISGTPESNRKEIEEGLDKIGLLKYIDDILLGFEYNKNDMDFSHFKKMAEHKKRLIEFYSIDVYFDDNPYYVSYLKNNGILVFQTILGDGYMEKYKEDAFFTSHLQEKQFDFLDEI